MLFYSFIQPFQNRGNIFIFTLASVLDSLAQKTPDCSRESHELSWSPSVQHTDGTDFTENSNFQKHQIIPSMFTHITNIHFVY